MLGISVYFKDLDEDYLRECSKIGVRYIFTSLHIPEENYDGIEQRVKKLIILCNELNIEVVPDVSPVTFEKLGIEYGDFTGLKQLGLKALRLDYGFDSPKQIHDLSKDFSIMLNASVVNEDTIIELIELGMNLNDIILIHNFYPKTYTGLSVESFQQKNELFIKYNMRIQAFVCGDELKRFPLYEGLPTLEKHRDVHPYVAAVELMSKYQVKDIFIGDSKAKLSTLKAIQEYMENKIISIKVFLEKPYEQYYGKTFQHRKDHSEFSLRLDTPRVEKIDVYHNDIRKKGNITIDNTLMGRYCGEIQLLMKDMPRDARVNVMGFIHPEYCNLLQYIPTGYQIRFDPIVE